MTEQKTDQAKEQSEQKPMTVKQSLARFDKKTAEKKAQEEISKETKPEEEKVVSEEEEECAECPGEKKRKDLTVEDINWDKVDYFDGKWPKPIKVQNKVRWVKDGKEWVELAQKGDDYTQKTQAVAEDKKTAEQIFNERIAEINKKLELVAQKVAPGEQAGIGTQTAKPKELTDEELEAKYYERYDIDKDLAEPYQIEIVKDSVAREKKMKELEKRYESLDMKQKVLAVKMAAEETKTAMQEAIKQYPLKEVVDKDGNNQTFQQFSLLFKAKVGDPGNKNRPIPEIAVETLKELHLMQQQGKEAPASTLDIAKLTPEELNKLNPDLYKKISEAAGQTAVAKQQEIESEQPPSLKTGTKEVNVESGKEKATPKTVKEGLKNFDWSSVITT